MTIKIEKSLVLSPKHLTKEMARRLMDDTYIDEQNEVLCTFHTNDLLLVWANYPQNMKRSLT